MVTKVKKSTFDDFLNPYEVVKELGLKEGMFIADFGSGAGHWALALANLVGKDGSVSAIDIRTSVLEVLDGHIKIDGLFQVHTIQADLEKENGSTLHDESQDVVLFSNILNQLKKPKHIFKEAYRVLKSGGKIVVAEWTKDSLVGPKNRISKKETDKLAKSLAFKDCKEIGAGSSHYILIYTK